MRSRDDRHEFPDRRPGQGGQGARDPGTRDPGTRDPGVRSAAGDAGREQEAEPVAGLIAHELKDVPAADLPTRLCSVAVELLPVSGASVSLHSDGLPVQLGASSAQAAYVTEVQATLGDGPCQAAAESRTPVLACDLTAGRDALRWPVFAQQATAAGVRATYSMPLGSDTVCVGTLDLYRDSPGGLGAGDLRTARLLAGVVTVALMALPRTEEGTDDDPEEGWLHGLAADHDEIYQATGMIMAQLGVGAGEALARLRAYAFAHGRTALEAAREMVAHRTGFDRE